MLKKEDLERRNCEELAMFCREKGIPYYHGKNRFRKAEMIEAILKEQKRIAHENRPRVADEVVELDEIVKTKIEDISVADKEKEATDKTSQNRERYLENVKIGTLIAFRECNGKLNTAAVQNVSFKRRQLRLVTQYGKEFIVSFDDVVWVRTKKRWPMFVLKELKTKEKS